MLLGFDHLIFLVEDLADGAARFERLGFSISERHDAEASPTENRLVCFADGSYIEIVRFRDPAQLARHRFAPLAETGGWADYVVRTEGLQGLCEAVAAAGLATSPPRTVTKPLIDGERWSVILCHLGRGVGGAFMPMLAEDLTDHHLRVPDERIAHANGARRIVGVRLAAEDTALAGAQLASVFGAPPRVVDGLDRFDFAGRWVEVTPTATDQSRAASEGILSVAIEREDGSVMTLDRP
ncbi:VOC family protein [Consotaella aegiceratis]|uniref:VOC family protein n=1 Tax=Consotaella aegiceratis TaxID=3097961 RepID=UPI002F40D93C